VTRRTAACIASASCRPSPATTGTRWSIVWAGRARPRPGRFACAPATAGPIRIDPEHRWHFVWEGTGQHYFFNGTTAYWLLGWRDDRVIESRIDRLARLKVNRIRVTIAGRTSVFYGEPVREGPSRTPFLTPWPAGRGLRSLHLLGRAGQRYGLGFARGVFDSLAELGRPDDIYHVGFDYGRFHVAHWQKFELAQVGADPAQFNDLTRCPSRDGVTVLTAIDSNLTGGRIGLRIREDGNLANLDISALSGGDAIP
jgi:hypothetical protein